MSRQLETPELHHTHRDVNGGGLRAAIFGAMDGLVSNGALIAGMIGGGASPQVAMLAGIAGLVAGAASMGVGEFTSVASQKEAAQKEIAIERDEIRANRAGEQEELAQLYIARGVTPDLAHQLAEEIHKNDDVALRIHVLEELGVDPDDLQSPWVAAGSSFLAFCVGALVPLLPLLLGATNAVPTILLTLVALFGAGAVVTALTGRSAWFGGARQLVLGAGAAALSFGIGHLFGVAIG